MRIRIPENTLRAKVTFMLLHFYSDMIIFFWVVAIQTQLWLSRGSWNIGRNPKWSVGCIGSGCDPGQVCALRWCLERFGEHTHVLVLLGSAPTAPGPSLQYPSKTTLPRKVGVGKILGRVTARADEPSWPKGYSVPYSIFSDVKVKREEKEEGQTLWYLSSRETTICAEVLLPGKYLDIACWWELENKIFCIPFLPHSTFSLPC